jgi:hypothetical protein
MGFIENNPIPIPAKERGIVVEFLVVGYINCRAILDKVAWNGCIRIIHKAPRLCLILLNLIDCTASLLKDGRPGVNHCKGCNKECSGLRIVDDDRGDLDSLAEAHIITLEAAADINSGSPITIRNIRAVNFLVEHPVDTVELVLKVREVRPQRTNLWGHSWNTWKSGKLENVKVLGQAKIRVFPSSIFAGFLDVVFIFLFYDLCRITCVYRLNKLVRAATMVKIRLLVDVIVCVILIEEDR